MKLFIVLGLLLAWGAQGAAPTSICIHYVEPFSLDLPAGEVPTELMTPDFPAPIRVAVARGEAATCAVLALGSELELGPVTIAPEPASGPGGETADLLDLFLIKGLPRSNRYLQSLLGEQGMKRLGGSFPDILIRNETLFNQQATGWRRGKPLTLPVEESVTTILGGPGLMKYLLVKVKVPEELEAGLWNCAVRITGPSDRLLAEVPCKVEVLPFDLPHHGKILQIANDFGSPERPHFDEALPKRYSYWRIAG